jgi:hypothetical protein
MADVFVNLCRDAWFFCSILGAVHSALSPLKEALPESRREGEKREVEEQSCDRNRKKRRHTKERASTIQKKKKDTS